MSTQGEQTCDAHLFFTLNSQCVLDSLCHVGCTVSRWLYWDEQESDGTEGTRLDNKFEAGNLTVRQYRDAMEPRLIKLRRRTEVNDANGAFELGMRLLNGSGVRRDPVNGCRYVMNAAAQGHCFAQALLGSCYYEGSGVAVDAGKAVKWWKLASAGNEMLPLGVASAMHNLGVAYCSGTGVKRDYLLGCHWLKKGAKSGDVSSQYNLAYYYTVGKGVRKHERKAAYWLLQAARQGCPEAAFELAARYWRAHGLHRDVGKASQWLRKAAKHLHPARLILEALERGDNVSAIDPLFPLPPVSSRRNTDKDMREAHDELQLEMRSQVLPPLALFVCAHFSFAARVCVRACVCVCVF